MHRLNRRCYGAPPRMAALPVDSTKYRFASSIQCLLLQLPHVIAHCSASHTTWHLRPSGSRPWHAPASNHGIHSRISTSTTVSRVTSRHTAPSWRYLGYGRISSMKDLLRALQKQIQEADRPLDHASVDQACMILLRLLAKHERAKVVARRDARRALWYIPPQSVDILTPRPSPPRVAPPAPPPPPDPTPAAREILVLLVQHTTPWTTSIDPRAAAHYVQALGSVLKQPLQPPVSQQLDDIIAAMQPYLPTMQQDCLAKLSWGLGQLQHTPSSAWMQALTNSCACRTSDFGVWSSVLLLEGLSRLPGRCPSDLPDTLIRRLRSHLSWLTPAQGAALIGSLAEMGYLPSAAWLEDWCQQTSSKLPGLTMAQGARVAAALWRLRYVPPQWWLKKFLKYTEQAMVSCEEPSAVIYTATALARLNLDLPRSWLHRGLLLARGRPPPPCRTRPRIPYVPDAPLYKQELPPQPAPSPVDDLAWVHTAAQGKEGEDGAQGRYGHVGLIAPARPQPPQLPTVDATLQAVNVATMSESTLTESSTPMQSINDVSNDQETSADGDMPSTNTPHTSPLTASDCILTVYVIAKFRENPAAVRHVSWAQKALAQVLKDVPAIATGQWSSPTPATAQASNTRAKRKAAQVPMPALPTAPQSELVMRAQRLVDVLYACAELRHMPTAVAQGQVLSAVVDVIEHTTPAQRATVMVCLAVLRITPDTSWCQRFFTHLSRTMHQYSAQELANTLTAAAYLHMDPGETVVRQVLQVVLGYDLVQLAMLVRKLQASRIASEVQWLVDIKVHVTEQLSGKAG